MEKFITLTHLKMAVHSLLLKINNEINALSPIAKTGSYTDLVDKPNNIMIKGVDYVTAGQKKETTLGQCATAEGLGTTASGQYSHAEGYVTTASGQQSHAEGYVAVASGSYSHAEGDTTKASGVASHAEGYNTTASGYYAHAESNNTTASGNNSHAEGYNTVAQNKSQHVFGEYNILDTGGTASTRGTYIEIVGNGTSSYMRRNARTLDWSGNETLAGKLTLGAAPTNNMDAATKQYVDNAIPTITDTYSSTSHNGMSGVAVNSAITTAIGNINSFDVAVVSSTSAVTTPNNHTIYFVPQAVNSSVHDEYMYINNNWELIGTTSVDLSGYLQSSDIAAWAKAANKPSYTAAEVGAVPTSSSSEGNTNYSSVSNNSGIVSLSATNGMTGSSSLELNGPAVVLASTKDLNNSSITLKTNNVNNIVLSEGNTTITGVVTPTSNTMAANKQYVDNAVANITHPTYTLSISGNRITLTPSSGTASYIDLPVYDGSYEDGYPVA